MCVGVCVCVCVGLCRCMCEYVQFSVGGCVSMFSIV